MALACGITGKGSFPPAQAESIYPPGELAGEQTMHYPHGAAVVVCAGAWVC